MFFYIYLLKSPQMLRRLIVIFSFLGLSAYSQTFYSGFEDGSPEGWVTSQKTSGLTIVGEDTYNFLSAQFDGSEEMAIVNEDSDYWTGNYFITSNDGEMLRTVDDILLRNPNDFDLHIRYGFKGANGLTIVTSHPIIVKANSGWEAYYNYYGLYFDEMIMDNLTITSGLDEVSAEDAMEAVKELFQEVVEFKIFHNPQISYEGVATSGRMEMESIVSFGEISRPKVTVPQLTIVPNPFIDRVALSSDREIDHIVVYNAQGTTILNQAAKAKDLEIVIGKLTSGVYLFEVHFTDGSLLSKQLVRQ